MRAILPELKDIGAAITVEQLVHHTSGVRDYYGLLGLQGWKDTDRLNNEIIVELLAKQRSLNFTPGSQFLYSNSNYVLLAEIVERVSGKPLPEFAKERLFDPLGMKDTQFESDARRIVRNRGVWRGKSADHDRRSRAVGRELLHRESGWKAAARHVRAQGCSG